MWCGVGDCVGWCVLVDRSDTHNRQNDEMVMKSGRVASFFQSTDHGQNEPFGSRCIKTHRDPARVPVELYMAHIPSSLVIAFERRSHGF